MSIQICLRGFLLAYYSDYSILFLVIVKKGQNKWLDNVCLKFWVLLISIDKLPRHLACFGGQMPPLSFMFKTPTPLRYSEQHILGTNTGVMCLPFFFLLLQLTIERLRVILHSALLCCPVLTLTPGIPLGQAVMHLAAQCGAAQLFLNTISNFNCPDNSFKFLWFAFVDSKFEVSLEFISVLQKFSPAWISFFFLLGCLISYDFFRLFISTNPIQMTF